MRRQWAGTVNARTGRATGQLSCWAVHSTRSHPLLTQAGADAVTTGLDEITAALRLALPTRAAWQPGSGR
jgi:hypothetical protein